MREREMTLSASLLVLVVDHENQECRASVSVRSSRDQPWRSLDYDPALKRHVLKEAAPGPLEVRAEAPPGWRAAERSIQLRSSDRQIRMAIGPLEALFYTDADGLNVFFTPTPLLGLDAAGRDVQPRLAEALARLPSVHSAHSASSTDRPANRASLQLTFEGTPEQQSRDREEFAAIVDQLRREEGYTARLSAAIRHPTGDVEWFTNEMVVGFHPGLSPSDRQALIASYNMEVVREQLPHLGDACILSRPGLPHPDIFAAATDINQDPRVAFAEPNRLYEIENHSAPGKMTSPLDDFLYPEQPELMLVQAPSAWQQLGHAGSPDITVAVVDIEGVDSTHANLPRPIANWDFVQKKPQDPSDLGGDHGTQCASSAVGKVGDGVGTAGVAGGCGLIAARISDRICATDLAAVWAWAAGLTTGPQPAGSPPPVVPGADIILNAWGPKLAQSCGTIRSALEQVTTLGRNGRGCVICFSGGNHGYQLLSDANPLAIYDQVIAVGASIKQAPTTPCSSNHADPAGISVGLTPIFDTRAYYSPYGDELDLVAPSSTSEDGSVNIDPIMSAAIAGRGEWIASVRSRTQLAQGAASGATEIIVQDASGFTKNGYALLGLPGGTCDSTKIADVAGNQLTIDPLTHSYAAGTPVSTGPADYSRTFGGTSYAAATVAGAAALVLSANPQLTWQQVRDILCATAAQIDRSQSHPDGQWLPRNGRLFSKWYGWGRLDVAAAVATAAAAAPATLSPANTSAPSTGSAQGSVAASRQR